MPALDRGEDGLTEPQRFFLIELVGTGSAKQALSNVDRDDQALRRWMKEPDFKRKYDEVIKANIDYLKSGLNNTAAEKVTAVFEEALEAQRPITVKEECPECGHRFTTQVSVDNWATRLKAAETLLKVAGVLKEEKKVDITHMRQLSAAEQSALIAYRHGTYLPPHMVDRLKELGYIEGEYRVLPPGALIAEAGQGGENNKP